MVLKPDSKNQPDPALRPEDHLLGGFQTIAVSLAGKAIIGLT
jgi:hypothetical protein